MNAQELVEYQRSVENYIQDVQMTDFFENLIRLLVLSRPKNPVEFLAEVLENRLVQRLILIHSTVAPKRNEIVQAIGNSFNYKVISIDEILADQIKESELRDPGWLPDALINEAVFEMLKRTERHHRGVIISGYPANLQQALFLQQKGVIPERYFFLANNEDFCRSYYDILYDHSLREQKIPFSKDTLNNYVESALKRDALNKKDLQLVYGQYIDEFDLSKRPKEDIIENLKQILKLRDRKFPPLRFPRVMIMRPPKLKERAQSLVNTFSKRYGLQAYNTADLLEEQVRLQTEVGKYIHRCIKEGIAIPDEIVESIVYTKLQSTEARNKGWILEGFPKNLKQLNAVKSYNFFPNLILTFTEDEEILINKLKQVKIDPQTKFTYETVSENKQVMSRLKNLDLDWEQFRDRIKDYYELLRAVEDAYGDRVQQFKIEKDSLENIIRITDVFLNNPKIYN